MAELCHCELSGLPEVIQNGKHCELCEASNRHPFTPEQVNAAFQWFTAELYKLSGKPAAPASKSAGDADSESRKQ